MGAWLEAELSKIIARTHEHGVGQEALATNPASMPIGARVCGVSNRR
jgi:hypothetical protein